MNPATRPIPSFRVGQWVSFLYGPRRVPAQIVEDRGPLGMLGRRLYRVRFQPDQGEASTFELPEEDLKLAETPGGPNPLLRATLDDLALGKRFVRISPDRAGTSERTVVFSFSDGTEEARTFQGDHATFMGWWKETSGYLRGLADAFGDLAGG